jgi:hypothetical protein
MLRDEVLDAYAGLYGDPDVARFIGAGVAHCHERKRGVTLQ